MKRLFPERLKAALLCKGILMLRCFVMALGIALLFSMMSCDLFKTRTPEEPSQHSSTYVPPTDVLLVLQNMVSAFQDGDAVNYTKSFSETSFSFEPATSARTKYGGELMSWDKTKEQRYFEKVLNHFSNNARVVLEFDPFTPTYNNNTSQVETAYHITLPLDAGVIKKFNGKVQYTLSQDQSGFWSINQWVDVEINVSDSTWSDLKGVAYSQW
jgi:hypothetical protein